MINGIFRTGSGGSRGDATPSLIFVMYFASLSPTLLRYVYASILLKNMKSRPFFPSNFQKQI